MFRALAVLRVVLVANLVGLTLLRLPAFDRPVLGIVLIAGLTAWSGFTIWAYRQRHRLPVVLVADLVVALAAILASPLVKGEDLRATLPGFWVMAAMISWSVRWRWRGGLVAAVVLSAADLAVRAEITQANYGNVFLLMIGGPLLGYVSESLQRMAVDRDEAERAAAAAAERSRLARAVHDGVLQVLAMVQRRGAEAGGEMARLAELAGEQEVALRSLIHQQDLVGMTSGEGQGESAPRDLTAELERLARTRPPQVRISTPGTALELDPVVVVELTAVVGECLANVASHVGTDARAWVLLEDRADGVVVSVRDEGPGIPEGRLSRAAAEGRMGVADSIVGRMRDLGGSAVLTTGSFGTEWELTLPS